MWIDLQTTRELAFVILYGRLRLGDGAAEIRTILAQLIGAKKYRTIFLDLGNVTALDCAVLGELACARAAAGRGHAEIILINPTKRITELLVLTRLFTLFPVAMRSAA